MKRYLSAVLAIMIVFPYGVMAQEDREYTPIDRVVECFAYEYQMQYDLKDSGSIAVVQMRLEIGERYSKFYEEHESVLDSLWFVYRPNMQQYVNAMIAYGPSGGNMFSEFCVYKNYPKRGDILYHAVPEIETMYVVEQEQPVVEWELVPNSDTLIATHRCQMAKGSYGGREWRAWYTMEIPINDGPYKFSGLPGLIVRVADVDNEHIFQLRGRGTRIGAPIYMVTEEPMQRLTVEQLIKRMKVAPMEAYRQIIEGLETDDASKEKVKMRCLRFSNFIER